MINIKKVKNVIEPKTKYRIIQEMSRIFDYVNEPIKDEELEKLEKPFIYDSCVVCGVIPLTQQGKEILKFFINKDLKIKHIDWKPTQQGSSKISIDYMIKILNILKIYTDAVKIETSKDYLIKIESEDFEFIIAPRIESE